MIRLRAGPQSWGRPAKRFRAREAGRPIWTPRLIRLSSPRSSLRLFRLASRRAALPAAQRRAAAGPRARVPRAGVPHGGSPLACGPGWATLPVRACTRVSLGQLRPGMLAGLEAPAAPSTAGAAARLRVPRSRQRRPTRSACAVVSLVRRQARRRRGWPSRWARGQGTLLSWSEPAARPGLAAGRAHVRAARALRVSRVLHLHTFSDLKVLKQAGKMQVRRGRAARMPGLRGEPWAMVRQGAAARMRR